MLDLKLRAKEKGVLERDGHTEATVDLMRLAGLKEVGLCCEIMKEDGMMSRLDDLLAFTKEHNLKIVSIEQLIHYRKVHDELVKVECSAKLPTDSGTFELVGFDNQLDGKEHIAIVKGDVAGKENVLVRIHSECFTGDILGSYRCDCGSQLKKAMRTIEDKGEGIVLYLRQEGRGIGLINKIKAYKLQDSRCDCGSQLKKAMRTIEDKGEGIVLYLRQEGRGIGLINKIKAYKLQDSGLDTVDANKKAMRTIEDKGEGIVLYLRQEGRGIGLINKIKAYKLQDSGLDTVDANLALGFGEDERDYAVAAQMLKALGVKSVVLMTNNPAKIDSGLDTVDANLALGFGEDERDYAVAAQMLKALGVKSVVLMTNNPAKIEGLESYGMKVVKRAEIEIKPNEVNEKYLRTKFERMGHKLHFDCQMKLMKNI